MKDALGHGSNGPGSRLQSVIARAGLSQADRLTADQWMGHARQSMSYGPKSEPVSVHDAMTPIKPSTTEAASIRAALRDRGFAAIRKD